MPDKYSDEVESDFIVIGAGAAGCVVASRLSEDQESAVLLLEAGGMDDNMFLKIPTLSFMVMLDDKYNWNFDTEPVSGFNNRSTRLFAGKVVGGSGSINAMLYRRGHSSEFDRWEALGCTGWGWEGVLPFFKKAENSQRGENEWHGADGPVSVRRGVPQPLIVDRFLKAVEQSGYPLIDDFNANAKEGFGIADVNVSKSGRRASTAAAYLAPALTRSNLTLRTGALVTGILIEDGRATGVKVIENGAERLYRARKEIILSAGAVKSPHLLMLSGIGPSEDLNKFGIKINVESPNIGKNFQNHSVYFMQYICNAPVTSLKYMNPFRAMKGSFQYLFTGRGFLTESPYGAGGFFKTDPDLEFADIQVALSTVMTLPISKKSGWLKKPGFWALMPNVHGFAVMVQPTTPFSRGKIGLYSADPMQSPAIFPNYLDDPRDIAILATGARKMRKLMQHPAISKYIDREISPGAHVSDDELEADIANHAGAVFHQSGTCAMGGEKDSVVDPRLRVRGVRGLRVADNSIIPIIPGSGTHPTAIMIGEKAAYMIKADWDIEPN